MSTLDFETYIKQLKSKIQSLKSKIDEAVEQIKQVGMKFELDKNDWSDQVSTKLQSYNPSGLSLELPSRDSVNLNKESIEEVLNDIFKL